MDNEYPKYLYKYQSVSNTKKLSEDYSIDNLFKCHAVFSSRKNFNDLFDSKINIINPTPKQVKTLANKLKKKDQLFLRTFIDNGKFTEEGRQTIKKYKDDLNKLIDSYAFYCLSKNCKSNLMWSHYADSHRGFCIEFKSEHIKADKVSYQDEIPRIEMISLLGITHPDNTDLGEKIWGCLRTKLNEWEYEQEYRFQASNSMRVRRIPDGKPFVKMSYDPEFVESIIFGCRTPELIKEYIIKNLPYKVNFKQAVARASCIEITDN